MSSEWQRITFGEFISLQRGHDLPEQEREDGNVPILGSFGVTGWHSTAKAMGPGLTIGRSGASFGVATYTDKDYFPLNTTLYVIDFNGNHPRFAYYFAKDFDFSAFNSGSAQPSLNRNFINPVKVSIPPFAEQKAIAHILGTLDDKIELNRKTNETLEAMAKALFQSWFVDFDPVRAKAEGRPTGLPNEISELFPDSFEEAELGEIPGGWQIAEMGSFVSIKKDSIDPSAFPAEVFDHYSIPAFDSGQLPSREPGASIKSLKFLVGDEHLLISKLNPSIPRIWIPFSGGERRGICSTEFLACEASSDYGRSFVYCLASSDLTIEAMSGLAGGTSNSHQRIRPGDFLGLRFCVGDRAIRSVFNESIGSALLKGLELRQQSKCLASIRDTLLPKLISGELRIPDAERLLEEAGV